MEEKRGKMKAKSIVITHSKGGVGKSTTTYQAAGYLHKKGYNYLVIDTDIANRTISTINNHIRNEDKLNIEFILSFQILIDFIRKAKEKYDYIIIDTGGNMDIITQEAIKLADKIITPLSHDAVTEIVGFTRFKSVLKKLSNPEVHATFCNIHTRAKDFSTMTKQLQKYPNMKIMKSGLRNRALYKTSLQKGLSVAELKTTKNKLYNKNLIKAQEELETFVKEILK